LDCTAQCHHCSKRTGYQPYLSLPSLPVVAKATGCPRCGRTCPVSPLDYADTLCMDNAGLTRSQALQCMEVVSTRISHSKSGKYQYVEDYLAKEENLANWPSLRTLTTPLAISCHDCGGTYTFYRNAPDIQVTPPLYCVYCASNNTTVQQLGTEPSSWLVLAQVYGCSVDLIQTVYELWASRSSTTRFSEFMSNPAIQKILAAKQALQEVATNA